MAGHTVDGDTRKVADLLDFGAGKLEQAQVLEDQVVVHVTRLKLVPTLLISKKHRSKLEHIHPFLTSAAASACAFLTTCCAYALNDGCAA